MPSRLSPGDVVAISFPGRRPGGEGVFIVEDVQGDVFRALHKGGLPLKEFFRGDRIAVIAQEGDRSAVYPGLVREVVFPEVLVFRAGDPRERRKREYVRIDDLLCVECVVRKGHEQEILESFLNRSSRRDMVSGAPRAWFTPKDERNLVADLEKGILNVLVAMETKIDAIARFLAEGDRRSLSIFTPRPVNLSASGIRFVTTEPASEGDFTELRLHLKDGEGGPVDILGTVIRISPPRGAEEGTEVAVRFRHIEEGDRNRIIRYIFSRQRETIRSIAERREGGIGVE